MKLKKIAEWSQVLISIILEINKKHAFCFNRI